MKNLFSLNTNLAFLEPETSKITGVRIKSIFQNGNFTLKGFPLENSRSLSYLLGLTSQEGGTTK